MTIFTLYYTNQGGGYFNRLCRMMRACAEAGNSVHYMAPNPFPGLDNCSGITWHPAPLPGPPVFKALIALVLWPFLVLEITIRSRIDTLAVFGFPYAAICGIAAKLMGKPIITFVRSDWVAELELADRSLPTRTVGRMILQIGGWVSNTIVANSTSLGSHISKRLGGRRVLKILPNDIQGQDVPDRCVARAKLAKTCGYPEDRFVIGYNGTFKPRKQVWQVIDIFYHVRETQSVLVLVGDGADRERVVNRTKELDLQDRVYWLGWQPEVRELLAGMDLTILPSRFEGSPNAVLESIGVGTPVIGADVMGIADILPPEMLFPLDDIQMAATIVRNCTSARKFYSKLLRLTREVSEKFRFDWDSEIVNMIQNCSNYE